MTNITGVIKSINVPDDVCLTDVKSLIKSLETLLAVELDAEQITNVVVSTEQPDITDRDVIWFRINNAGNFIGIFVYIQGQWLQMFPHPNGIFRMYGDSRDIPEGYALIENGTSGFTTAMVSHIRSQWLFDPTSTYYVIFDVVYVGL